MGVFAPAFTLADARTAGISKDQLYRMVERGEIDRVGRGVFVRPEDLDPSLLPLAAATALRPTATLCLTSALVVHDLSDAIPFASDIALPRGVRHPAGFEDVTWHSFETATFSVGRQPLSAEGGLEVSVYSPERTIVDCFRLMHQEGSDVAHEALRRWLRRQGSSAVKLLAVAEFFPRSRPRLRAALEVLL